MIVYLNSDTLYTKLLPHLGSTLQKLILLKFKVFLSNEIFVGGGGVTNLSHSVDVEKFVSFAPRTNFLRGELQFVSQYRTLRITVLSHTAEIL